jgi:hypothetical protein
VRLDHQPYLASWRELQGIARGQREVHFHLNSAFHSRGHDYVALLE